MKTLAVSLVAIAAVLRLGVVARAGDPGRIDAYVTPYYDSSGPIVRAGTYSSGLASNDRQELVATVLRMKKSWRLLTFAERYVAAIRLYDFGYRNEATYWFYSAQYGGRLFASLVDQKKMGSIGSPAFELFHAQDAFFELVGPNINGYAFGDIDGLLKIIRAVRRENRSVPDVRSIYPGVAFIAKQQWAGKNTQLDDGLKTLATSLSNQKAEIARERAKSGTEARFGALSSTPFPGGY